MIARLISIAVCLMPCAWGVFSINAGLNSSELGPVIGGGLFLFLGLAVIGIIIWDWMEQIVNTNSPALTDCDQERFYRCENAEALRLDNEEFIQLTYRPFTADELRFVEELDKVNEPDPYIWYTPEEIEAMNTPDPNLIHPDDAKHRMVGSEATHPDDLKREFTATIEHRDGQPPKIIDIKV